MTIQQSKKNYETIKNKGVVIHPEKDRKAGDNNFLVASIMRIVTKCQLLALEGREVSGNIKCMIIAMDGETLKKRKESYTNKYDVDIKIMWTEKTYENKEDDLLELFRKLKMTDDYEIYKQRWIPDLSNMKLDRAEVFKAEMFFKMLRPYENEKGEVLLAEDCIGNTVWAYSARNYSKGTFSYRVYMLDTLGRPKPSTSVRPSAVGIGSPQIINLIKNYNGKFTTLDGNKATEILWLYDMCRQFQIQEAWDGADPMEVYEDLKEWTIENIGAKFKVNDKDEIPVYCSKTKDRIDIGIWQKSFKWVLQKQLGHSINDNEWLRDAANQGWIIPQISSSGQKRNGFNPSDWQRKFYARENKNERVYRLEFTDEEKEMIKNKVGTIAKETMTKGLGEVR